MKTLCVLLFLAALGCSQGSHNDETCDALDDILDYLDTLGTYGNCSRNSDCDEIVCENRRGNELSLKFLPCRSHPAVRVELSYDGDTYFSKTVSDETLSVQVTVNNFTFSVIVTVEDRRDSIYLEVLVKTEGLTVTVVPNTKVPQDCTDLALIVGLTVGLTVGGLLCCCLCVCIAAATVRRRKGKRETIKLDELQEPLSVDNKDDKT